MFQYPFEQWSLAMFIMTICLTILVLIFIILVSINLFKNKKARKNQLIYRIEKLEKEDK